MLPSLLPESLKEVPDAKGFKQLRLIEDLEVEKHKESDKLEFQTVLNSGWDNKLGEADAEFVALDCEMEGGTDVDLLIRVSVVDFRGNILFDSLVQPPSQVMETRAHIHGIDEQLYKEAPNYYSVRKHILNLLKGKILIGHTIRHDLEVL
jgi:DNA polymerase III epsilon subunit-like protein